MRTSRSAVAGSGTLGALARLCADGFGRERCYLGNSQPTGRLDNLELNSNPASGIGVLKFSMLRRLIMRSSHHFGSVFRLTPLRAHSISCMLTIICAVLLHQGNIIRKRSLGVDIVRLPPTKVATNQTHG